MSATQLIRCSSATLSLLLLFVVCSFRVALFDGDPFEYTSHAVKVIINGRVVSEETR
jgi:hypothetical protein